jgi:outer membrane beta-barrel protein
MRSMILALVAVALVAAGPAFAGGAKGTLELGGFGGYGWLDDYGIYHPENHALYGARIGYFFNSHWNLEASWQRMPTHTEYESLADTVNDDVHVAAIRGNLLYNFGSAESAVRFFLTAGAGSEKFEVENVAETHDFGWNAGAGIRWFLGKHWNIRTEGRYVHAGVGDVVDESQNNIEATAGLSLLLGGKNEEHAEAPPPAPPNQAPTVTCAADRGQVLPGETVNLNATATDPEGGSMTYNWTTTAGHVTGTGASVALDFTGVNPPASATVTVKVTDDHGNPASSDCAVQLMAPAPPPAAVSCNAGGFPKNLSRITNVDKACLDDVAQKLSADPRAHVVIIGHSDSHETTTGIALKRANAMKDYLVKERNVDGSRVTTRSAPPDTGADATAQAGNRRVEVWFVPEGAKDPE